MFVLITWHGTVVCPGSSPAELVSGEITAEHSCLEPFAFAPLVDGSVPDLATCVAAPGPAFDVTHMESMGPAAVVKSRGSRFLHIRRNGFFLCALGLELPLTWDRSSPQTWETFLLLERSEFASLIRIVETVWCRRGDNPSADVERARISTDFKITLGPDTASIVDLLQGQTFEAEDGIGKWSLTVRQGDRYEVYCEASGDADLPVTDLLVETITPHLTPISAEDIETFRSQPNTRFDVSSVADCFIRPPITMSASDDDLFVSRYCEGEPLALGNRRDHCWLRRESLKFVVAARLGEGVIFDERGSSNRWGFLSNMDPCPTFMKKRAGRVVLHMDIVKKTARRVNRKLIVFYNGNLQNYYHWLIEAMIPLDIIRRHMVPGFELMLPPFISTKRAFDYQNILEVLGFGDMPRFWCEDDIILADEVLWADGAGLMETIPAEHVRAFNRRLLETAAPTGNRNERVYIKRRGVRGVQNDREVERFLLSKGFRSHLIEDLAFADQVALFQSAEFVVAAHGAGLSNLVFCREKTKVIEMSPDSEMRPFFWLLSQKLGLTHGVMFCATENDPAVANPFQRRMLVDVKKLSALFTILDARR